MELTGKVALKRCLLCRDLNEVKGKPHPVLRVSSSRNSKYKSPEAWVWLAGAARGQTGYCERRWARRGHGDREQTAARRIWCQLATGQEPISFIESRLSFPLSEVTSNCLNFFKLILAREKNNNFLFHLFINLLVDSCALIGKWTSNLGILGQWSKQLSYLPRAQTTFLWQIQLLCFNSAFWEPWQDAGDTGNEGALGSNFSSVVTAFRLGSNPTLSHFFFYCTLKFALAKYVLGGSEYKAPCRKLSTE